MPTSHAPLAPIAPILDTFVRDARAVFGDALRSVVLFGSAAEDRLRPSSDLNLLVVLSDFDPHRALELRAPLVVLRAAVDLRVLYLREDELPAAFEHFAVKFADLQRRHRVLFGPDPLIGLEVPREAAIARLRQTLFNTRLRLREQLVTPTDLATANRQLADLAAPLRAAAAELLALEDTAASTAPTLSPRDALVALSGDRLAPISRAREHLDLDRDPIDQALIESIAVVESLLTRAEALTP
jgi:predicted nucleotidyltransferase